jgi:hypothetical protein
MLFVQVHVEPDPLTADTRALRCLPTVAFVRVKVDVVAPEAVEHPAGRKFEAAGTSLEHTNH